MTYADLQEALRVLGLGERASLKEIKARHRELVKRHHPDTSRAGDPEIIREVNAAFRIISDYISEYRFSFAEDEFYVQNPEERIWRQFADDPLWGKK
jgi:curved DNA-binding protein CbpA